MRQKPGTRKGLGEKVVRDIRRATRKQDGFAYLVVVVDVLLCRVVGWAM